MSNFGQFVKLIVLIKSNRYLSAGVFAAAPTVLKSPSFFSQRSLIETTCPTLAIEGKFVFFNHFTITKRLEKWVKTVLWTLAPHYCSAKWVGKVKIWFEKVILRFDVKVAGMCKTWLFESVFALPTFRKKIVFDPNLDFLDERGFGFCFILTTRMQSFIVN